VRPRVSALAAAERVGDVEDARIAGEQVARVGRSELELV
jgi:hypothetical protein